MRGSRRVSEDRARGRVEGSEPGQPVDLPDEARAGGQALLRRRVLQQVCVHVDGSSIYSNIIFAHFLKNAYAMPAKLEYLNLKQNQVTT